MIANATLRRDPTRTTTLRASYRKALTGRFRTLAKLIRQTIVDNDALYLTDARLPLVVQQATPGTRLDFAGDPDKVAAFMAWLRDAISQEIITAELRNNNVYIRRAYQAGSEQADRALRRAGYDVVEEAAVTLFGAPRTTEALQILFTRNYEELKGITEEMSRQIARVLSDGMLEGIGPREMARRMVDRVDKIGITRATILARTEIVNAHATATLDRYEMWGVRGVSAEVELSTAGDDRVCQQCQRLEGKIYSVSQARGVIPVHPQCRCTWLPVPLTANQLFWNYAIHSLTKKRSIVPARKRT